MNTFYAVLPKGVENEEMLFDALSNELKFPDYFTPNWNAVYDCMCDFHWIIENKIKLVHQELPNINSEALKVYLQVLSDAVNSWTSSPGEHIFEVVFCEEDEKILKNLFR